MKPAPIDLLEEILIDGLQDFFPDERDYEYMAEVIDTLRTEHISLVDKVVKRMEDYLAKEAEDAEICPACYSSHEPIYRRTIEGTDADGNRGYPVYWAECPDCGHEEGRR